MYTHSSLSAHPKPFNQTEFCIVTERLKHLVTFLFQIFCCSFGAVLGVINLFHDPVSVKLWLSDRWPHIWHKDTLVYRGIHGWPNDCKVPRPFSCKTNPNPLPLSLTVGIKCLCSCSVFVFALNLELCTIAKHLSLALILKNFTINWTLKAFIKVAIKCAIYLGVALSLLLPFKALPQPHHNNNNTFYL